MRRQQAFSIVLMLVAFAAPAAAQTYVPDRFAWETRTPAAAGFDGAALQEAIAFSVANENPNTKDLAVDVATTFSREPPRGRCRPTPPR